ncbi:MAG TPA: CinA family protein [Oxalicibacterium sp.]|uniref:CinA family protein n=1 Tax=Oxalicibacterium sp. TaxID=2766525 RepID=UPI002BB8D4F7|nr:CinA family protein [Oxalicibacterium sp.]HWU97875.1 CinA family protein [Oxalicibacterium sp.]
MEDLIALCETVGQRLKARGLALATAESCTGGGVAQAITDIAGSSAWFDCGFVTYSNASKMRLLGVPGSTLEQHGAVSAETAAAMCEGALRNSKATVSLSTTGIAGPDGGVPGKPVGTVFFGWACGDTVRTERVQFSDNRHAVRMQTVEHALRGLLILLDETA